MRQISGMKEQLVKHLNGGEAFMPLDQILNKIEFGKLGERPKDLPYSFYELFYHIWFTQNDILKYCTEANYHAPDWPEDYWPLKKDFINENEWEELKIQYIEERQKLSDLILEADNELLNPVPSNPEHSFFREILLVIEHTAYHSGQLLIVLRHLGLHSS